MLTNFLINLVSYFSFRVHAEKLLVGKTPIDRLLTLDTEQIINANVTIHGNILLANNSAVEIGHLIMNGRIFGVDVPALIEDSYIYSSNESIEITAFKQFDNVTVDRLVIDDGCDFWQTGQTTEEIQKFLNDLQSDFRVSGPIIFDQQFSIENLTVTGAINDIPSTRFGNEWLLFNGSQVIHKPTIAREISNFLLSLSRYLRCHKISLMLFSMTIFNCTVA